MNNRTLGKIALTTAVALGGVVFLVKSSVSSAQHYMMVDDLIASDMASMRARSCLRS